MEPGTLLLGAALLLLVVAYLVRPFVDSDSFQRRDPAPEVSSLLAERDRILNLISDLDLDYAMDKLDAEEYQSRRAELVQRGADILREIDELHSPGANGEADSPLSERERALEMEIAERRRVTEHSTPEEGCPNCGANVEDGARFCSKCGEPLEVGSGT